MITRWSRMRGEERTYLVRNVENVSKRRGTAMKILVIEDKAANRKSAEETLGGHEVAIVSSFDEVIKVLEKERVDEEKVKQSMIDAGFRVQPQVRYGLGMYPRDVEYWRLYREAEQKYVIPFPFEVVLTDMMMPMSYAKLAPTACNVRGEVPYGFILALRAVMCGAKFVAMVTDSNHHDGPMTAALDLIGEPYYGGYEANNPGELNVFNVNGAKVVFVHSPFIERVVKDAPCSSCLEDAGKCRHCKGRGDTEFAPGRLFACRECNFDGAKRELVGRCGYCKGVGHRDRIDKTKDWGRILADLLAIE